MLVTWFINVPDWLIQLGNEGKPSFRRGDRRVVPEEGHYACTILYCLGLGIGPARYTSPWIFVSYLRTGTGVCDRHGLLTSYPLTGLLNVLLRILRQTTLNSTKRI